MRRVVDGKRCAQRPIWKKVAFTWYASKVSSSREVYGSLGPSSKLNATTFSSVSLAYGNEPKTWERGRKPVQYAAAPSTQTPAAAVRTAAASRLTGGSKCWP